eukprot:4760801-Lingulodinium_polyedra.AAC.1
MKFQKSHSRKWLVKMTVLHRSRKKLNALRWTKKKIWLVGRQNKFLCTSHATTHRCTIPRTKLRRL